MDLFRAAHEWRWLKDSLPKICSKYSAMMKLGTVIPYLKNIQRKIKSRDTSLEFY